MNYNRRRNIFTLSDFQPQLSPPKQTIKSHRGHNFDPFERDPFKIQSYNFHYADRPTYPLKPVPNRAPVNYTAPKNFDTFYYNHDFTTARNDKENTPSSKFNEFRRRKLLHEQQLQVHPVGASVYNHSHSQQSTSRRSASTTSNQQQQYDPHHRQIGGQSSQQVTTDIQQSCNQQPMYPLASAAGSRVSTGSIGGQSGAASNTEITHRFASPITQQYFNSNRPSRSGSANTAFGVNASSMSASYNASSASAFNNSPISQLMRFGISSASRDYLSALRGPHPTSIQAAAQIYGGRPHGSSSRTALGIGESGIQNKIFERAVGGYTPGTRSSSAEHTRRPSQHIESRSQNLIKTSLHQLHSSASGCRINININGLDSKQLNENVTIKIDSENRASLRDRSSSQLNPSKRTTSNMNSNRQLFSRELPTNNLNKNTMVTSKISNEVKQMNIRRQASTSSLNIDKHQSKVKEGISAKDIHLQRSRSSEGRVYYSPRNDDNVRPIKCGENKLPTRDIAERMPRILPGRINEKLRHNFTEQENPSLYDRSTNNMSHIHSNYQATLSDYRNMRCHTAINGADPGARKVETLCRVGKEQQPSSAFKAEERKLLNTRMPQKQLSTPLTSRATRRLTARSPIEAKNYNTKALTGLVIGPCTSPGGSSRTQRAHSLNSSEQSLKPPFNVNINVYAEKLKLLRV